MSNLKQEPLDIKSPIFTPRPGWGGKLKKWLSRQQARLAQGAARHFPRILPTLSFSILAVGIYLVLK